MKITIDEELVKRILDTKAGLKIKEPFHFLVEDNNLSLEFYSEDESEQREFKTITKLIASNEVIFTTQEAQEIRILHKRDSNFQANTEGTYDHVCTIFVSSLEEAFKHAQNDDVLYSTLGLRSTSVGDIFCWKNKMFLIDFVGFVSLI